MIKVFNIILNGIDAEKYASLSNDDKKEFIIKHTNQRNEKLIDAFLQKPLKNATGCLNCGELNNIIENPFKDANISEGISEAVENSDESIVVAGSDEGNNIVRSKKPKRRKTQ
jgi:hypothetical protein